MTAALSPLPQPQRPPLRERVAAEIRATMGRLKLNQAGLARAAGKSEMWVSRRVNGDASMAVDDLELIATVLRTTATSLLAAAERPDVPAQRSASDSAIQSAFSPSCTTTRTAARTAARTARAKGHLRIVPETVSGAA